MFRRLHPSHPSLIIAGLALCASTVCVAAPAARQATLDATGVTRIEGVDFGHQCESCEVLARFENGRRVALPVDEWRPSRIRLRVPDMNQGAHVWLSVRTSHGESAEVIAPVLSRRSESTVLERQSRVITGQQGVETVHVDRPAPGCNAPSPVFESARIVFKRQRFADAAIVRAPDPLCTRCDPIEVRWHQEPTGELEFSVLTQWRHIAQLCEDRQR